MSKLTPTAKGKQAVLLPHYCTSLKALKDKLEKRGVRNEQIAGLLASDIAMTLLQGSNNPNPSITEWAEFYSDFGHDIADIFKRCLRTRLEVSPNLTPGQ